MYDECIQFLNNSIFQIMKYLIVIPIAILCVCYNPYLLYAEDDQACHTEVRADNYAPIGVMGDHIHRKGDVMVSYRYMFMPMRGNKMGADMISDEEIFNSYMIAPQSMNMQMHMIGVMYAPVNFMSFMLMGGFIQKDMDMDMDHGTHMMSFSTKTSGMSDLKFSIISKLYQKNSHNLLLQTGISFPTGSVQERNTTPMQEDAKLPYAMQTGTGTYDITAGLTYTGNSRDISWGLQPLFIFRTGTNSEGYRFGDRYSLNTWVAYGPSPWVSISARFKGFHITSIKGVDSELNPMMSPQADTENTGRNQINGLLGVNFTIPKGALEGIRVAAEYGIPLYQYVENIQMKQTGSFMIGVQYTIRTH